MPEPQEGAHVLLVASDSGIVDRFRTLLGPVGCQVEVASDIEQAGKLLRSSSVDVVIVDQMLAGAGSLELLRQVKGSARTSMVPVILMGPYETLADRMRALRVGADEFLPRDAPSEALLARLESLVRWKQLADELERAESVIASLARAVRAKDGYSEEHTRRVADYAGRLAEAVSVPEVTRRAISKGALLYDIGKITVPDSILKKPGKLDRDEWRIVKQHPVTSAEICLPLRDASELVPIVRHHHERLDGSGYPDGVGGDEIPLGSQIVAIADFYSACTSERPYREAMTGERACELLREMTSRGLMDSGLVETFIDLVAGGPEADGNQPRAGQP